MDHEAARKRVCMLCLRKTKRRDPRVVLLSENEKYLELLLRVLPEFNSDHSQHSVALCASCARVLRSDKAVNNVKAKEFLSKCRRSPRKAKNKHCTCQLCLIANPEMQGCMPVSKSDSPVRTSSYLTNATTQTPSSAASSAYVSHSSLKQIQLDSNLSQNQLLTVTRGFRFATHGGLQVEPGLKHYLVEQNKEVEDLFKVRRYTFYDVRILFG